MGRKSLADERTTQILDAFERCIVKYGYEQSSLEKIADEANVKRSLIRHYLGNRNDLNEALINRILEQEAELTLSAQQNLKPKALKEGLLNHLFLSQVNTKNKHIELLLKALWQSAEQDKRIKKLLKKFYKEGEKEIKETLNIIYPNAKKHQLERVSHALLCLSEGLDNLQLLEPNRRKARALKQTAALLLESLE